MTQADTVRRCRRDRDTHAGAVGIRIPILPGYVW